MFENLIKAAQRAASLHRQRKQLAGLSNAQLQDIGLTRSQADREARRPVWDAPEIWKYRRHLQKPGVHRAA